MKIRESLEQTRAVLEGVQLPAGMPVRAAEQIVMPVSVALRNIGACIEALQRAEEAERARNDEPAVTEDDL